MTVRFTNRARKDIRRLSPENKARARRAVAACAHDVEGIGAALRELVPTYGPQNNSSASASS